MNLGTILLILLIIFLFGGGYVGHGAGWFTGGNRMGYGFGGFGVVLLIIVLVLLFR